MKSEVKSIIAFIFFVKGALEPIMELCFFSCGEFYFMVLHAFAGFAAIRY
jgi:hypothetical protein